MAGIKIVDDTDDLILISQNGILIRIHAADINVQSRYGSGVRVMRLVEDDKVAVVARVDRDNDAETAKIEDTGETDPTPEELAAIEAEGRKMGITNLISIITDENAASCRFHEKNGFVKEGHLHDIAVKFGRRCGVCYYRKELG